MALYYKVHITMGIDPVGGCHSGVAVRDTEHIGLDAVTSGQSISGPDYARYVMLSTHFYGLFTTVGMLYLHF